MQNLRDALEQILQLCDDQTWSHAARMMKIKGVASQALNDLNDAPRKKPAEAPKRKEPAKADNGGEAGDKVQEPNTPPAGKVVL